MSLLNRLWSGADWWDKEENRRQAAQTRAQQPKRPVAQTRPQDTAEWKIRNAKFGVLANNPNKQNQLLTDIQAQNLNKGKALVQSAVQSPRRVFNATRDVFDANTQSDIQKRVKRGEAANYFDQQKALGNKRPYQNIGAALAGSTARFLNTGNAAGREVRDTALMYGAQALGRDDLYKRIADANNRFKQQAYQPNSGLLGQGTIFDKPEDFNTMGAKEITKRVAATTAGTALEIAPLSKGAGLGAKVMSKAPNTAARTGLRFGTGSLEGAAQDVLEQQITRDNYSPMQTAMSAVGGGVLANAAPAISAVARQAGKVTTRLAGNVTPLNEVGAIGKDVRPLASGEMSTGLPGFKINNFDNAPIGQPLRINNPTGAFTETRLGNLKVRYPADQPTQLPKPFTVNNPDAPLKITNNTGAPLANQELRGAARQAHLSKNQDGYVDPVQIASDIKNSVRRLFKDQGGGYDGGRTAQDRINTQNPLESLKQEARKYKSAEEFFDNTWNRGLPTEDTVKFLDNTPDAKAWYKLLDERKKSEPIARKALSDMEAMRKKYVGKKNLKLTDAEKKSIDKQYNELAKTVQNHLDNYGGFNTNTGYVDGKGLLIESSTFDGATNAQKQLTDLYNEATKKKGLFTPLNDSGSAEVGGPLIPIPKKVQEKLAGGVDSSSARPSALRGETTQTPQLATKDLVQMPNIQGKSLLNNTPKDKVLRDIALTKKQIIDTEADAILTTSGKGDLRKQIMELGGVSSSAYESFPKSLKRKGGFSADRVAQNLGFDSEDALVKALDDEMTRPKITRAEARIMAEQNLKDGKSPFSDDWNEVLSTEQRRLDELSQYTGAEKVLPNQPSSRMSAAEKENLFASAPAGTERRLKVQGAQPEKNIPVSKLTRDGDTVTATNVNPNIKKGEKRFALTDDGELIEDRKGAYRVFTDNDGRVQQVRIGNEVYTSKDFGDLSDVNDYGSTLATMRRNVERGFGKETGEKLSRFLVDHQQAQATKMIERQVNLRQDIQKVADDLGINFGVGGKKAREVSADIQKFGEGEIKRADLETKYGKDYATKIVNADKWFRKQYDNLLDEMNTTLTKFGYDPVPKRQNYYTHFQDETLWNKFGLKMQEIRNLASPTMQDAMPESPRGKISNKLAGESEFTQPNKRFNPFALRREGNNFKPDAFQAFERYLNPTLNNIYMTPSITRARVISKAVAQDADIMGKDANKIIIQMKEWANNLAGKSNRFDRPMVDSKGGQMYLKAAQWAQKKAGQNTIIGNLSTAVMQPIVLGQTAGKFGYKNTILAAMQEMSTAHGKNAAIRQSSFMKRRYAEFLPVTAGKMDRARDVANTPLEVVEQTAARITWNAAHNDAISKGLKGAEAIRQADIQTEKTLAGRAIGERPELFRSKGAGPLTMYQLEVNNFWQQFGKEMTKSQAAKTLVAAYGLNLVLQEVTGRQVGFNPIDAAIDSYQELQKEDKDPLAKAKTIGQRWAGEFVDNAPFIAPIANAAIGDRSLRGLLGQDSNVGRFGVSSPISALTSTTNVGGVPIPQNLIMPFGGNQVKKTYEGLQAYLNGGLDDKDGKRTVDIPQTVPNLLRAGLFGKGAIPEVSAYYGNIGKKKVDQKPVPNQTNSKAGRMAKTSSTVTKDGEEVDINTLPLGERFQEQMKNLGESGDSAGVKTTVKQIDSEVTKIFEKYGLKNPGIDTQSAEIFADWQRRQGKTSKMEQKSEERKLVRNLYKSTASPMTNDFLGISSDNDMRTAIQDGLVQKSVLDEAIKTDNMLVAKGLQSSPTIGNKLRAELGYNKISKPGSGRGRGGGRGGRKSVDPFKYAKKSSQLNKELRALVEQAGKKEFKKAKKTKNYT